MQPSTAPWRQPSSSTWIRCWKVLGEVCAQTVIAQCRLRRICMPVSKAAASMPAAPWCLSVIKAAPGEHSVAAAAARDCPGRCQNVLQLPARVRADHGPAAHAARVAGAPARGTSASCPQVMLHAASSAALRQPALCRGWSSISSASAAACHSEGPLCITGQMRVATWVLQLSHPLPFLLSSCRLC